MGESAEARCVALSQTADAQAREIERLAAEAKSAREAAVEWEGKALAAAAKVETRASVAEEAARKAEESAREKQRVIEDADLVCAGVADEEAVAAAVDSQLGAIKGDADYKVYEATRNVDALLPKLRGERRARDCQIEGGDGLRHPRLQGSGRGRLGR